MNQLSQVITDYLQVKDTDYAIMVNGDWGCGKTYYIKKFLFPEIIELPSPVIDDVNIKRKKNIHSEFKLYEPVYISLYGVSSVESIYSRVLSSIFPFLQNKILTALTTVTKSFLKSKGFSISSEEQKTLESFVEIPKNKVLFFDDLERVSKTFDIQEVLGFLNTYTEHKKLKVIIICNDKKVKKKFTKFKEKTVRFTYNFQASIESVYDTMISEFNSEDYKTFLTIHKNIVTNIFDISNYKNLRTLRFILEIFKKIYKLIPPNNEYKNEILNRFFFFTVIYSVEYKEGASKVDLDSLPKVENYFYPQNFDSLFGNNNEQGKKTEKEPEYFERFAKKYENIRSQFFYYSFIANYIHYGYLESEKLNETLEDIKKEINAKEVSEDSKILNKLRSLELLSDEEFNDFISNVLKAVEECKFNLYTYPDIYAQLINLEFLNIEDFKITEKITNSFKRAIDESKKTHKYNHSFNISITQWDSADKSGCKDKYDKIYDYAVKANEDIGRMEHEKETSDFLSMISQNKADDLRDYLSDFNNRYIFKDLSVRQVFDKLISANGRTISAFLSGIHTLYPNNRSSSLFQEEITFFNSLESLLNPYLVNLKKRTVKVIFLTYIDNKIKAILKNR